MTAASSKPRSIPWTTPFEHAALIALLAALWHIEELLLFDLIPAEVAAAIRGIQGLAVASLSLKLLESLLPRG